MENFALKIRYLLNNKKAKGCNMNRHPVGELHHIYEQLQKNLKKFSAYFRMSIVTYDYILEKNKIGDWNTEQILTLTAPFLQWGSQLI